MRNELFDQLSEGVDLNSAQMREAMNEIMDGKWEASQIRLFLTALRSKGETVDELVGAALAMREHMTKITTSHAALIDTCGTGGDGSSTFNISTAAAIVTAASGLPVAKHGNRSVTSRSGSSEVLAELGVNVEADVPLVQRCLDELGICFCYAPLMHRSMKHVAEIRRQLGVRTIFNSLGPLCNPASAEFQLLGVGISELLPKLAAAAQRLGVRRAAVVRGDDGLDEVTIATSTSVHVVTAAKIETAAWSPAQFGLAQGDLTELRVNGPAESAKMIRTVLAGDAGPARDIVVANTSAALWTASTVPTLGEGVLRAAEAIDSGAARQLLHRLAEFSHQT